MENRGREDEEPLTPTTQRDSNIFSDEYEVVDLDVADGFRQDDAEIDNHHETHSTQHTAAYYAPNANVTFAPALSSRNSTRKSRSYDNPFTTAEEISNLPLTRSHSTRSSNFAPGIAHRSISSASSHQYAATNNPQIGGAGPSHPYTMYPQGTILRSPSIASVSTSRPVRRSSSLRHGPQHPYGMYTQGIADSDHDDEIDDDLVDRAANPVPVGFGLGQTYRRVRGPEGEEQDIIGEYGHAEQLPPYSRFPDDGPEKAPVLATTALSAAAAAALPASVLAAPVVAAPSMPAAPANTHTRGPVEGTDPGMPLMHQQMSRLSQQSMTDASALEQAMPLLADTEFEQLSSESGSSMGKKSWKEKNWKERRTTRFCGIPFGWILIGLCCIAFAFAVLVGSLVGYLAGARHPSPAATSSGVSVTVISTSLLDASIIATPTNSPATGTFALTLGTPQATQSDCLTNAAQQAAWDCSLAGMPAVAMTVGLPASPTPSNGAFLFYASDNTNISYGAQYQFLQTQFSPLIPVQDNEDPAYGPAFLFQQTYNKIVVLAEDTFTAPSKVKRQGSSPSQWQEYGVQRKQQVAPGERPWFCFFNNTILEGFIYVQQPAVFNSTTGASTSPVQSSQTSTASAAAATAVSATPTPTAASAVSTTSAGTTTASPTSAASQQTTSSASLQARTEEYGENIWSVLSLYPYMVKLEERRLPNNTVQPYCQQYQILDNNQYNTVLDASNNPIMFDLAETDPPYVAYESAGLASNAKRDTTVAGACHCQWMHGAG